MFCFEFFLINIHLLEVRVKAQLFDFCWGEPDPYFFCNFHPAFLFTQLFILVWFNNTSSSCFFYYFKLSPSRILNKNQMVAPLVTIVNLNVFHSYSLQRDRLPVIVCMFTQAKLSISLNLWLEYLLTNDIKKKMGKMSTILTNLIPIPPI